MRPRRRIATRSPLLQHSCVRATNSSSSIRFFHASALPPLIAPDSTIFVIVLRTCGTDFSTRPIGMFVTGELTVAPGTVLNHFSIALRS